MNPSIIIMTTNKLYRNRYPFANPKLFDKGSWRRLISCRKVYLFSFHFWIHTFNRVHSAMHQILQKLCGTFWFKQMEASSCVTTLISISWHWGANFMSSGTVGDSSLFIDSKYQTKIVIKFIICDSPITSYKSFKSIRNRFHCRFQSIFYYKSHAKLQREHYKVIRASKWIQKW